MAYERALPNVVYARVSLSYNKNSLSGVVLFAVCRTGQVFPRILYLGRRERFYFLSLLVWIRGVRLNCWLTGLERVPLGWYIADTREINGDNFLRNSGKKDPGRVQETWSKLLLPPFYWIRKENIQPLHGHNDRRHYFFWAKKRWKAGKRATIKIYKTNTVNILVEANCKSIFLNKIKWKYGQTLQRDLVLLLSRESGDEDRSATGIIPPHPLSWPCVSELATT